MGRAENGYFEESPYLLDKTVISGQRTDQEKTGGEKTLVRKENNAICHETHQHLGPFWEHFTFWSDRYLVLCSCNMGFSHRCHICLHSAGPRDRRCTHSSASPLYKSLLDFPPCILYSKLQSTVVEGGY